MWFRACKQVTFFCFSLGFIPGGSLSVGLVIYILDKVTPTGSGSHHTEYLETQSEMFQMKKLPAIGVTYKIGKSTEPNSELSKWRQSSKTYNSMNLKTLSYVQNATTELEYVNAATMAIVGEELWCATWSKAIYVYSTIGVHIKTITSQTDIDFVTETDDGDIVALSKHKLIVIDKNGNTMKLIYNKYLNHISHRNNVIYRLDVHGNRILKFNKTGDKFVRDTDILLTGSRISYDRMHVGENTLFASHIEGDTLLVYNFNGKPFHLCAILSVGTLPLLRSNWPDSILCGIDMNCPNVRLITTCNYAAMEEPG